MYYNLKIDLQCVWTPSLLCESFNKTMSNDANNAEASFRKGIGETQKLSCFC